MKITKEITFDSAHMLSNYEGKCSNLHGHTYRLQVTLEGKTNISNHMLLDFNVLKEVLDEIVMKKFDHALIFSDSLVRSDAENALLDWSKKYNKNYIIIPQGKTTCEDMSFYIKQLVDDELRRRNIIVSVFIKLWETPTSFAEC